MLEFAQDETLVNSYSPPKLEDRIKIRLLFDTDFVSIPSILIDNYIYQKKFLNWTLEDVLSTSYFKCRTFRRNNVLDKIASDEVLANVSIRNFGQFHRNLQPHTQRCTCSLLCYFQLRSPTFMDRALF